MFNRIKSLFAPKYQSLNRVELNRKALLANYAYLKSLAPDNTLIPVLKSNAYGHGLKEVATMLKEVKPEIIGVDSYPEYRMVSKITKSDILIMEEMDLSVYKYLKSNAVCAIYNIDTVKHLLSLNKPFRIHIFLNTGMNREGIQVQDIDMLCELLKGSKIELEGVMSHYLNRADEQDGCFTKQSELFKSMYNIIIGHGFTPTYRHIDASSGTLLNEDEFYTAHRVGLALYGYNPLFLTHTQYDRGFCLQPVMSIRSTVVGIQSTVRGDFVGYDGIYRSGEDETIVTTSLGYAEGLPRVVSNDRQLSLRGQPLYSAGLVSMNLSSWRLQGDDVTYRDSICIISDNPENANSMYQLAQRTGSIYETLVRISPTIRRVVK